MTELKPCPFCGCKVWSAVDTHGYWGPNGLHGKGCIIGNWDMSEYCDKATMVAAWNTRTPPATQAVDGLVETFIEANPGPLVASYAAVAAAHAAGRAEERAGVVAAWCDVLAERERQVSDEHWSILHDDKHTNGELAQAAACYAYGEIIDTQTGHCLWPWFEDWWKPGPRRRDLVKAGALILAEIERLDRADAIERGQHTGDKGDE